MLVPSANVKHLMLRQGVVEAVREGRFHIHSIETIDQGVEVLTGVKAGELQADGHYPADTINGRVAGRLAALPRLPAREIRRRGTAMRQTENGHEQWRK
ncbi:MAG: hypothetical protein EXR08_02340 [Alphaproteobacteria bacterium]|nr:hypothetical protein [Alphaproteobacteria bacterium]